MKTFCRGLRLVKGKNSSFFYSPPVMPSGKSPEALENQFPFSPSLAPDFSENKWLWTL